MASLTAQRLAGLLSRMGGRPPQALARRLLQGRSREECAAFYGISVPAFDVLLLRAAQALEAAAWPGQPRAPLLPTAEEEAQAAQLARALEEAPPPELGPEVKRHARLLSHLRAQADEVNAGLDALERAAESSPRARRDAWIRRGLVLLLAAAALLLYQRQQASAPAPQPRMEPRKEAP